MFKPLRITFPLSLYTVKKKLSNFEKNLYWVACHVVGFDFKKKHNKLLFD